MSRKRACVDCQQERWIDRSDRCSTCYRRAMARGLVKPAPDQDQERPAVPSCHKCSRPAKTRGYCLRCYKLALILREITHIRRPTYRCPHPGPTCDCRRCEMQRMDEAAEAARAAIQRIDWGAKCMMCGWEQTLTKADAYAWAQRGMRCERCHSSLLYDRVDIGRVGATQTETVTRLRHTA